MLLVTGASGVLGSAVLTAFGPGRCIALQHRTPVDSPAVRGDLTQSRLGLPADDYRRLLARIDGVLHAGAVTTTAWSATDTERVNVEGTRNVVRVAEDAGVPMHHISTFYVQGRDGTETAQPTSAYQATKRAAEQVATTAQVPTAIYRLPMLIGDTDTGVTSGFRGQGIYAAAKTIVSGDAHVLPAPAKCWVDFLPRDHVAQCLRAAVEADLTGSYWITAGTQALTLDRFLDVCIDIATELGRDAVRPKLVDPHVVERFILPAFGDLLPPQLRMRLQVGTTLLTGMANGSFLPDSRHELPAGVRFPAVPDVAQSLRRSLRYWSQHVTLRAPVPVS